MMHYIAKYILQIYLLHSISAAGIRILLFNAGITHIRPHFVLGVVFSFVIPILCAMIAKRIPCLNIVFFPVQTVKILLHKEKRKRIPQHNAQLPKK